MYNIVYCVYNSATHIREVEFSLLSTLGHLGRNARGYRIIVCTPQKEAFARYPVIVEPVTEEMLADWRGPEDYIYRTKIVAISYVMDRYPAPTLLLDSDTYFTASPQTLLARLHPGRSIMDRREDPNPDHIVFALALKEAFPGLVVPLDDGRSVRISEDASVVWNSGTVGLHHRDRMLLDIVLGFGDAIYRRVPIFNVEQFAFSEILRQHTSMSPSYPTIEHYWGGWVDPYFDLSKRQFVHAQIEAFFHSVEGLSVGGMIDRARRWRIRPFRRPLHYRVYHRFRKALTKAE